MASQPDPPPQDGTSSEPELTIEIKRDGVPLRELSCREFVAILVQDDLDHQMVSTMETVPAVFVMLRALIQAVNPTKRTPSDV